MIELEVKHEVSYFLLKSGIKFQVLATCCLMPNKQVKFDFMITISTLYWTNMLSWILIVLAN